MKKFTEKGDFSDLTSQMTSNVNLLNFLKKFRVIFSLSFMIFNC